MLANVVGRGAALDFAFQQAVEMSGAPLNIPHVTAVKGLGLDGLPQGHLGCSMTFVSDAL